MGILQIKILKLIVSLLNPYAHPTTLHGAKLTLISFAYILEPYENTHTIKILYFDVGLTHPLHAILFFSLAISKFTSLCFVSSS
jgi:hypothetical protein